jgi:phosphosulfolactate synthase
MVTGPMSSFLVTPPRPPKPRERGISHVMDAGLPLPVVRGVLESAADYIDIVKLGWGTSLVTKGLDEKLALYAAHSIPVVCGGTLFEAAYGQGVLDEYKRWLSHHGITHAEIADGVVAIPREVKLSVIADFAADFTVMSEVGSKDADALVAPYQWVRWITEELEAGAWKVIAEGREDGSAGLFRPNGEIRSGLVDEIAHEIDVDRVIFDAPSKSAQAWFIRRFGAVVNLGNVAAGEIIGLETLRLGLRADTLKAILLD